MKVEIKFCHLWFDDYGQFNSMVWFYWVMKDLQVWYLCFDLLDGKDKGNVLCWLLILTRVAGSGALLYIVDTVLSYISVLYTFTCCYCFNIFECMTFECVLIMCEDRTNHKLYFADKHTLFIMHCFEYKSQTNTFHCHQILLTIPITISTWKL